MTMNKCNAISIMVAFAAVTTQSAHAHDQGHRIAPPAVPATIQVPAGNVPYLLGHAQGTQNYVCLPAGASFAWSLFTPQATLFSASDRQLTTHFFSPNPDENRAVRAAWQDSHDTSTVWASAFPPSFDPAFVAPGAIPWLLLETVGTQAGPRGGDELTITTFIHRVNTSGGSAPPTGCAAAADVGKRAFVPYTADYFFYKRRGRED
jgi:hypothetical protein